MDSCENLDLRKSQPPMAYIRLVKQILNCGYLVIELSRKPGENWLQQFWSLVLNYS